MVCEKGYNIPLRIKNTHTEKILNSFGKYILAHCGAIVKDFYVAAKEKKNIFAIYF